MIEEVTKAKKQELEREIIKNKRITFFIRKVISSFSTYKQEIIEDSSVRIWFARSLSNDIFDLPVTFSGKISKNCILPDGYRRSLHSLCAEHRYCRHKASNEIINKLFIDNDHIRLYSWLDKQIKNEYTVVNYVTSAENKLLEPIQRGELTKDLSWEEQYRLVGIEVVDDPGTNPLLSFAAAQCFIKGKFFTSANEAGHYYNVSPTTISSWKKKYNDCFSFKLSETSEEEFQKMKDRYLTSEQEDKKPQQKRLL